MIPVREYKCTRGEHFDHTKGYIDLSRAYIPDRSICCTENWCGHSEECKQASAPKEWKPILKKRIQ